MVYKKMYWAGFQLLQTHRKGEAKRDQSETEAEHWLQASQLTSRYLMRADADAIAWCNSTSATATTQPYHTNATGETHSGWLHIRIFAVRGTTPNKYFQRHVNGPILNTERGFCILSREFTVASMKVWRLLVQKSMQKSKLLQLTQRSSTCGRCGLQETIQVLNNVLGVEFSCQQEEGTPPEVQYMYKQWVAVLIKPTSAHRDMNIGDTYTCIIVWLQNKAGNENKGGMRPSQTKGRQHGNIYKIKLESKQGLRIFK